MENSKSKALNPPLNPAIEEFCHYHAKVIRRVTTRVRQVDSLGTAGLLQSRRAPDFSFLVGQPDKRNW
jgi:hypothetical protein